MHNPGVRTALSVFLRLRHHLVCGAVAIIVRVRVAFARRGSALSFALLAFALVACATTPPPLWASGGASIELGRAVWVQADGEQLLIDEQGRVFAEGKHIFSVDRAGRVVDDANDPVALLDSEGQLYGTDAEYWGRIGVQNAAPPWSPEAWMRITKRGTVVLFDQDGETVTAGQWTGCDGAMLRTCTLLTHISLLQAVNQRRTAYPYGVSPYWGWGSPYWGSPYWGSPYWGSPFWGFGSSFYFY